MKKKQGKEVFSSQGYSLETVSNVISKVMYMFVGHKGVRKLLLNIFLVLSDYSRGLADKKVPSRTCTLKSLVFPTYISPLVLPGKFQADKADMEPKLHATCSV